MEQLVSMDTVPYGFIDWEIEIERYAQGRSAMMPGLAFLRAIQLFFFLMDYHQINKQSA